MPVINGQAVSAEITNPAFLDAQVDDIALGKIGFHNTDPQSGGNIDNIQRCVNRLFTASGVDENMSNGTTYNATSGTIVNGDPYQLALKILANKFDSITGHTHNTSVAGDGGPITVTTAAATTGSLGTVYLSHTTPLDVTGSDIIGTYNGQVALADHAHKGVRSIAPSGYSQLFNDIVFTPSGNIDISTSGQQIIFHTSSSTSAVTSLSISGGAQITGNVVLVPSGGTVLSESGQNITIYSSTGGGSVGSPTTYSLTVGSNGTPPTKGTVVTDVASYMAIGKLLYLRWDYRQSAGGSAGTGTYLFPLPGGFTIDSSFIQVGTTGRYPVVGVCKYSNNTTTTNTTQIQGFVYAYDTTHLMVVFTNPAGGSNIDISFSSTGLGFGPGEMSVSYEATVIVV